MDCLINRNAPDWIDWGRFFVGGGGIENSRLCRAGLQIPPSVHLLESGTYLRYIQELLGNMSSKTTEIYTHVSTKSLLNIKSPFGDLF